MRDLDEDRSLDFHPTDFPNCAAELGYRLEGDSTTREMMREFFEKNQDNSTRRSFRTSSHLTMEGGYVQLREATVAERLSGKI